MRRILAVATALLATALTAGPAQAHDADIDVVSSRPDQVSGGDALIKVSARHRDHLRITRNGEDVTDRFDHGVGLVDGLRNGRNRISVWDRWHRVATQPIKTSRIEAPIFSGPHQTPFV